MRTPNTSSSHLPPSPGENRIAIPTTQTLSDSTPNTATPTGPSFSAIFAAMAKAAAENGSVTPVNSPGTASAVVSSPAPTTASSGFQLGSNPWLADPTGSGPGPTTHYNPIYFATQQTAEAVAQMVGGNVVSMNEITTAPGSPFQQDQPNLMVELPNGGLINPGLVADIYTHGWNQEFVDQQVANEVASAAPKLTNS